MSAKHRAKSLGVFLPPDLRAALRARVGRNGSMADAARRLLQDDWPANPAPVSDTPEGRPLRLQLPPEVRAALTGAARDRAIAEPALALALLAARLRE
jgi:hypothetical protein